MRSSWFIALLVLLFGTAVHAGSVGLIHINGAIGPATAGYISRALDTATARNDECLIIQLDTPGGLMDSTRQIVETFFAAKIPVVVYVAPEGAAADSAGTYITLAADVAVMAPHSRLGAAHPVDISGGTTDPVMKQKMENDALRFMENIADKRHRNARWADSTVVQSEAATAETALATNAIDFIAASIPDLLAQLDGRIIHGRPLHTARASVSEIPLSVGENIFQLLWRPEIMMLLMLIAIYGIIGELSSPGAILPGVAGAIALVLLLYMSAILPLNLTGVTLVGLAIALFVIDAFTPTHGVLTGGGIIAFFLGLLLMFNDNPDGYRLPLVWIISATLVTACFFSFIVAKGIRAQFAPPRSGPSIMLGRVVKAISSIDSVSGKVFIEGETWNAVSTTPVETGHLVEVIGRTGLTLQVKPKL